MPFRYISLTSWDDETQTAIVEVASTTKRAAVEISLAGGVDVSEDIPQQDPIRPETERKLSMWRKAGQFTRAIGSKAIEGAVALPVLDFRHQCCHGSNLAGERVSEPCTARYSTDAGVFCKSCGCGEWKLANLEVDPAKPGKSKLSYPALECPRGKFSAVRGQRVKAGA